MYSSNIHKCQRFTTFENKSSSRQALVFLKLLDNSCPRDQALKFCKSRICLFDTTKKQTGPPNYRLIRNATSNKGWVFSDEVNYDLGKNYERPKTEEDKAFQKYFQSNNIKIVQEQQQQVEIVNKFMKEIDDQVNLKYNNLKELKQKVSDIRNQQEMYRNAPVNYLKFNGQRYLQLYDTYKKHYDNELLGFEKQFPKTVQEKQKRNEDFFIQVNKKQDTQNIQKKFIKLQNEGELIATMAQQDNNNNKGITIQSLQTVNDVKTLAQEFNKTQYVFDDEKKKSIKQKNSIQFRMNHHLINKNFARSSLLPVIDFQNKIEQLVTTRIDTLTNRNENCEINPQSINRLLQQTITNREKEIKKISSFTPTRSKTTSQSTRNNKVSTFKSIIQKKKNK